MKTYILYDGRANYDIDAACVMECFESKNDDTAKAYVKKNWDGCDCVLFDVDDNQIF